MRRQFSQPGLASSPDKFDNAVLVALGRLGTTDQVESQLAATRRHVDSVVSNLREEHEKQTRTITRLEATWSHAQERLTGLLQTCQHHCTSAVDRANRLAKRVDEQNAVLDHLSASHNEAWTARIKVGNARSPQRGVDGQSNSPIGVPHSMESRLGALVGQLSEDRHVRNAQTSSINALLTSHAGWAGEKLMITEKQTATAEKLAEFESSQRAVMDQQQRELSELHDAVAGHSSELRAFGKARNWHAEELEAVEHALRNSRAEIQHVSSECAAQQLETASPRLDRQAPLSSRKEEDCGQRVLFVETAGTQKPSPHSVVIPAPRVFPCSTPSHVSTATASRFLSAGHVAGCLSEPVQTRDSRYAVSNGSPEGPALVQTAPAQSTGQCCHAPLPQEPVSNVAQYQAYDRIQPPRFGMSFTGSSVGRAPGNTVNSRGPMWFTGTGMSSANLAAWTSLQPPMVVPQEGPRTPRGCK